MRLAVVLGAMVALGPLTIDMYLPAFPTIVTDLGTTAPLVQMTLTGSLIGLGLGQLLIGPYSDSVGRRIPLVLGTSLHVLTSVLCAFATDIVVLNVLRVVQGIGAAATAVVAMAMVRDLYEGRAAATMISHLMLVTGLAPILAPSLGSAVLLAGSWRWVFGTLAVIGAVLVAVAAFATPETLPPQRRRSHSLRPVLRGFGTVVRDADFVLLTLVGGLAFGGALAYVSGASFVFQQQYGLDEREFGLVFGLGAVALACGTQLNPLLLRRFTPLHVLFGAVVLATAGAVALLVSTGLQPDSLAHFLVPLLVAITGIALAMPNAAALALSRHGSAAGTAASVLGAIRFGLGSAVAPLVGVLGNDSTATAVVMAGGGAVALLLSGRLVLRERRRGAA
ncbi:multidrug effflux MFS transporter [Lentzea fradiae]|uniref:multidrug effflux MFS transporter n=1 Tax=Lentzea fradiae TaxID=200378 RepID=UPI001FE0D4B9|nr:multidrug effflux MFS transporter [Lentzea fradiae]